MYSFVMQSCRMVEVNLETLKIVGKSGQISLGKALAGMGFVMETLPGGDILLRHSVVVPINERWLHEPAMSDKLAQADDWMRNHPARESSLEEVEASFVGWAERPYRDAQHFPAK